MNCGDCIHNQNGGCEHPKGPRIYIANCSNHYSITTWELFHKKKELSINNECIKGKFQRSEINDN